MLTACCVYVLCFPRPYFLLRYVTFCPPFEFNAGGGEGVSQSLFESVMLSPGSKVETPAILVKFTDPTADLRAER